MLKQLAGVPRLRQRLRCMTFKATLEVDMDGLLMTRVDALRSACEAVLASSELHALFAIVLDVGNALNAGTSKGNAVGFKVQTRRLARPVKASERASRLFA